MPMSSQPEPSSAAGTRPVETVVVDRPDQHRFEILSTGQLTGYAEYRDLPHGRAFVRTVIDPRYRGLGLDSHLVKGALDEARQQRRHVVPLCPFVRRYLRRHPSYLDLVPDQKRFGLDRPPDNDLQHPR
jgi:predicted GNAT family acetyltransferase